MARPTTLVAVIAALAGCAEPPPPAPPPAASAAPVPAPQPFAETAWGEFRSARFELVLPLPDGHAWRIDDHGTPWLSATHAASGSTLLARTWLEDGKVNRHRCEEKARYWRKLPDREGAEMVEQRTIAVPAGFDTFVEVGVVPGNLGGALQAFAVAFGGRGHRCFAYVYTTTAVGPQAERVVGERLATMVGRSLGGAVLASELDPRIPRLPEPGR